MSEASSPISGTPLLVGDPAVFAIESLISIAYERLGFLALGFFVLHVGGRCYGVRTPNASMLACAFDQVERRIDSRGKHVASFSSEPDAGKIVDAYYEAVYAPDPKSTVFFGLAESAFSDLLYANRLVWSGGDEEFDDGSHFLHLDLGNRVRFIASFQEGNHRHDPATLKDVIVDADLFYAILQEWRDAFLTEWQTSIRLSEDEEDSEDHLRRIVALEVMAETYSDFEKVIHVPAKTIERL